MFFRTVLTSIFFLLLFTVSCSTTETVEEMNLDEINSWLNIQVSSCQNDPLCPATSPISGAKLSIFYFDGENNSPKEEDLILTAYTSQSGQYLFTELEGNQYFHLRVETPDSLQQTRLVRTDANNPISEEILFP